MIPRKDATTAKAKEVYRVLRESKQAMPVAGPLDTLQFGTENIRRSLELIIEYSVQQRLIPRRIEVNELFDELTRGLN